MRGVLSLTGAAWQPVLADWIVSSSPIVCEIAHLPLPQILLLLDNWMLRQMAGFGFGRGLNPILISRLFLASTRSNDTLTLVI
jgi:hypothetical protein